MIYRRYEIKISTKSNMKRILKITFLFLLFCCIFFISGWNDSPIQNETILSDDMDSSIFTHTAYKQLFSYTAGTLTEMIQNQFIHSFYVKKGAAFDSLVSLFPSEQSFESSNKNLIFHQSFGDTFHVHISVQFADIIPENGGNCFFTVSNRITKGDFGTVGYNIVLGGKSYKFIQNQNEIKKEEIFDSSSYNDPDHTYEIDVVRLFGTSAVYIDKTFAFDLQDDITPPISWEAGTGINQGGERINCQFSKFIVKK